MPNPQEPSREPTGTGPERWIEPFFAESTLWPVTLVLILSLVTFGAGLLLLALEGGNVFAIVGVLLLAGMSVESVVRDLRKGGGARRVSQLVVTFWVLSGLLAGLAAWTGIF